jgi:hypothetical protein
LISSEYTINSPMWYMELFPIESVCLVDYISELFVSSAHTCTKQHYIIIVISFTYQKVDKGTSQ